MPNNRILLASNWAKTISMLRLRSRMMQNLNVMVNGKEKERPYLVEKGYTEESIIY